MVYNVDKILLNSYKPFLILIILAHILYAVTLLGIIYINTEYIHVLNVITQTFICIFLLIRFNPYRDHKLHEYDVRVIFGSAILLLSNLFATEISKTFVGQYVNQLSKNIQTNVHNNIQNGKY